MRKSRLIGLVLILVVCVPFLVMGQQGQTPRNETLYIGGILWGPPQNFNPLSGSASFPCGTGDLGAIMVYETLFYFDMLKGTVNPLLAQKYTKTDALTLTVKMDTRAKWQDGKPLTASDVAYTFQLAKKYPLGWSSYWTNLDTVTAPSADTVVFKMSKTNPNALNIIDSFVDVRILPKHVWEKIESDNGNDIARIRQVFNEKPVGSGPYQVYFYDDTKISAVRWDGYWGKVLFGGKLPAPKYITHTIYKSNDAGNLALKQGEVDFSQQFIPQVWNMWKDGAPIRTYLKGSPYYIPGSIPFVMFNMTKPGLNKAEVRRALAMAIDYDKISELAISGYSKNLVPGITLPTPAESKFIDSKATSPFEFTMDVNAANALLDSIGAKKGADGIRVLADGTRLGPFDVECPYGWSDWNASCEIVVQSAKKIGIELRTKFPEFPVWLNDRAVGSFDILMSMAQPAVAPSQPWNRCRTMMYSKDVAPMGQQAFWNFGRYSNSRADEIIDLIPQTTDQAALKKLYTELDLIYLKDLPTIPLMYRPSQFWTVNESVWTGFPKEGDESGIPPQIPFNGAGIRILYMIRNK